MNGEPDWTLWKSFEAVVRAGSLSAAARGIGISQPTVGRHIEELEATLGIDLFERTLSGLRPTDAALRLYEPVAAAQKSFAEALMRAQGARPSLGGTVRITASHMVSNHVLPEILLEVRKAYPEIALELVPSDSTENLSLREADIAIRMFRPTQLELVTKKLGEIPIVAAAHRRYLEKRGTPRSLEELMGHDLIGLDRSDAILRAARGLGFELRREQFVVRSDGQTLLWELMRAGLGIGFAQAPLVRRTRGMRALLAGLAIPPMEVWLTSHRELFTDHRIRAVYDALGAGLAAFVV
ncbi:MAG: LysR family transcriptional regulator [Myxococcota bacterium]|nr:LysR family transcriptional regulator [Myxococcota bacterium]